MQISKKRGSSLIERFGKPLIGVLGQNKNPPSSLLITFYHYNRQLELCKPIVSRCRTGSLFGPVGEKVQGFFAWHRADRQSNWDSVKSEFRQVNGVIQPSLRDLCRFRLVPGVETPGYFQLSLSGQGHCAAATRNHPPVVTTNDYMDRRHNA